MADDFRPNRCLAGTKLGQCNQDALPGSKFCYRHDYRAEDSEFTGTVDSVLLEIAEGATDFNHLVDPQLRLSMALARQ